MSNYTKLTDFLAKDALVAGDPSKLVLGSELDAEFNALATAIATKSDGATSLSDGDKGDITLTSNGTVWTIDAGAVTLAKMANLSGPNILIGRYTSGAGVPQEVYLDSASLAISTDTLYVIPEFDVLSYDITTTTVSNTVAETTLLDYTISGGELAATGQELILRAYGAYINSTGANQTGTFRVYYGATGASSLGSFQASLLTATTATWNWELEVRMVRTGASTVIITWNQTVKPTTNAAMTGSGTGFGSFGSYSVTLVNRHHLKLTVQNGAASTLLYANVTYSKLAKLLAA